VPDVFVNYRTGDGEQAAVTVERELSHRFGDQVVFRDSKSIPAGSYYPEVLLNGLHACGALLAVIGPGWITAPDKDHPGRRALDDEHDWVRREIAEALAENIPVVPILVGRDTPPLEAARLPEPLVRLAYLQALPYDSRQADTDLDRIADALTHLVPGLSEREQTPGADPAETVSNVDSSQGDGPRFQARDVSGGITTTHIGNATGPIHSGSGDQHNVQQSGGDGTTFIPGDNHGGVNHRFGGAGRHRRGEP
jgi:hypothetical protein